MNQPDFYITDDGPVSLEFRTRNIFTFRQAMAFIKHLPYGRNADKHNLLTVFTDGCATCSTKHTLLKFVAEENHFEGLKLMLGTFRMNAQNTPGVSSTLKKYKLDYIPEAHCYLRFNNQLIDCTNDRSGDAGFANDLLEEREIEISQIAEFKIDYHKSYLQSWLNKDHINYSLDELWEVREQCIRDLEKK